MPATSLNEIVSDCAKRNVEASITCFNVGPEGSPDEYGTLLQVGYDDPTIGARRLHIFQPSATNTTTVKVTDIKRHPEWLTEVVAGSHYRSTTINKYLSNIPNGRTVMVRFFKQKDGTLLSLTLSDDKHEVQVIMAPKVDNATCE